MPKNTIIAKPVLHNGRRYLRVQIPKALGGGKRFFTEKKGPDGSEAFIQSLEKKRAGLDGQWIALRNEVKAAVFGALEVLGEGRGVDILDAAKMWVATKGREIKSVQAVVKECVAAKAAAGCRQAYLGPFENLLDRFASHCAGRMMHEVTLERVESFVNAPTQLGNGRAKETSIYTRRNRKIDLGTLFAFAVNRGYCADNLPKKMEKFRLDEKEPGIISVPHAEKLLRFLQRSEQWKHLLPFAALGLFAGLRPSEAQRLTWEDLGGKEIPLSEFRVAAGRGKKRANRFVTINDTCRAWLKLGGELPIPETKSRKVRELLKRILADEKPPVEFVWPKDGFRHSFVSYSFALHGETATAKEAGHRPDVMHRNYKQLVTKQSAEAFWRILPGELEK